MYTNSVPALISRNVGNTLTNYKTWGGIIYNVKEYGAKGDGLKDDTSAIQTALNAASDVNGVVRLPPGSYKITSTLKIPENITLEAYGAKIVNTSTHLYLLSLASNVTILGLELQGAGNDTANIAARAVNITGDNSAAYVSNIRLKDVYIHDIGFYGVYMQFAKDVYIEDCNFKNIGYGAIMGESVTNIKVRGGHIDSVIPGQNNNAYGVAFTRTSESSDLMAYPRSKDCLVEGMLIENIPTYEALDTHAGENIIFSNNTIRGCKIGISMIRIAIGATEVFAPHKCKATGNTIHGDGTGVGIQLGGAANVVGNPNEYAFMCEISDNILYSTGMQGNSTSAGILLHNTIGAIVKGNMLYHPYANGINIYHTNLGFVCSNNVVVDPQDNSWANVAGITLQSGYNKGSLSNNTLLRINDNLNTYVSERGIYIDSQTGVDINLESGYNNFILPIIGVLSGTVKFATFYDGISLFASSGAPNGQIAANPGSLCIDVSNGKLYVKESGIGDNTGWVIK